VASEREGGKGGAPGAPGITPRDFGPKSTVKGANENKSEKRDGGKARLDGVRGRAPGAQTLRNWRREEAQGGGGEGRGNTSPYSTSYLEGRRQERMVPYAQQEERDHEKRGDRGFLGRL